MDIKKTVQQIARDARAASYQLGRTSATNRNNALLQMADELVRNTDRLLAANNKDVVKAIKLSSATINTIRLNLFLAFIYNIISIPVAAGILYPLTGTLLTPSLAAFAMSLSSVSVVLNSLRLKNLRLNT